MGKAKKKESEKEMQKRRNEDKMRFDYIGETIIRNFIFATFMLSFCSERNMRCNLTNVGKQYLLKSPFLDKST